jgi:hypothetical protein
VAFTCVKNGIDRKKTYGLRCLRNCVHPALLSGFWFGQ